MSLKYISSACLPTPWAEFTVHAFSDPEASVEHLALSLGELSDDGEGLLTRVHSSCLTGDALRSMRCDCGAQLELALQKIAAEKCGLLLYLQQEGRGIGLGNKIHAYHFQDQGMDTVEANLQLGFPPDRRDYHPCIDMLDYFGVHRLRLMTNNPHKVQSLCDLGLEITQRIPHNAGRNPHNEQYIRTKINKMGHLP